MQTYSVQTSPQPDAPSRTPPPKEIEIDVKKGIHLGDAKFYKGARLKNQHYADHPPEPGWPYSERLKSLWETMQYDDFADEVAALQVFTLNLPKNQVDGILGPRTSRKLAQQVKKAADQAPRPRGNGSGRRTHLT